MLTAKKLMMKARGRALSKDPEYDEIKDRFEDSKKYAQVALKQFRSMVQQLHQLSASMSLLNDALTECYHPSDPMKRHMKKMEELTSMMKNQIRTAEKSMDMDCIQALTTFVVEFDQPKKLINQREKDKLKFDNQKATVTKLSTQKKAPKDSNKLPKAQEALETAKANYQHSNVMAKTSMANVLHQKGDAMDAIVCNYQQAMSLLSHQLSQSSIGLYQNIANEVKHSRITRPKIHVTPADSIVTNSSIGMSKGPAPMVPSKGGRGIPQGMDTEWFTLDQNMKQLGPYTFTQLRDMYRQGSITDTSYVFGANMADWGLVSENPQIRRHLK